MKTKLNRNDLKRYISYANATGRQIKKGYCCHYDRSDDAGQLLELGYNSGVYGWNWSLYMDDKTLYIDGYRNY